MNLLFLTADGIFTGLKPCGTFWSLSFILILLILCLIIAKDIKHKRTDDTVRVLGNSYYAIYGINFRKRTYHIIKGSDYIKKRLPVYGKYEDLLEVMSEIIEKNAYKEFADNFSIENINRLVSEKIKDFGGEFLRLFDNEYKWVTVRVLYDEALPSDEAILCFREVDSERRWQLKQLKLLEDSLASSKRSEETKQAFFSNMSHELRTPLNAIIGLSELAEKNLNDKERLTDYIDKIKLSSSQMLAMINDILEMSRLEQGKVVLDNKQFSLVKCIKECTDIFTSQAELEGKFFSVDINARAEYVFGDSYRISQLVNNLLSNAFKFTPEGGSIHAGLKTWADNNTIYCRLTVSDTGIGMSKEFLEHIFEPYARETRFASRSINGTGLGMSIVHSLVTQMGGQINVESTLGKGTTFTVTLPFASAGEKETPVQPVTKEAYSLNGIRILLAEDNEINMEIAAEILSEYGAEVVQAWNGKEAVEKFTALPDYYFDFILMDMQMPVMDGCTAAKAIRKSGKADADHITIIAVSANAFSADIAAAVDAGMNAHISKPIDFSELYKTLNKYVK